MKTIILFMIVGVLALFLNGYLHEQVHVSVFESYGIKSQVYYLKYFPDFVTKSEEPCPNDSCILANSVNEAVGYNTLPIFLLLLLGLLIIISELSYSNYLKEAELRRKYGK